jgi:hypothetical protein
VISTDFRYPPFAGAEDVIAAFAEKAKGFDVEILQAVDDHGKIVCENVGDDGSVSVPEEARGHWLMHSHARSSAPLSTQDIMVINAHKVKMNMAVCHDGSVSWTTGFKRRDLRICYAADMFISSYDVQMQLMAFQMMGGEDVGCPASNWWLLDFFTNKEDQLRDLHIKSGTDSKPWALARAFEVTLPRTFSYYAE